MSLTPKLIADITASSEMETDITLLDVIVVPTIRSSEHLTYAIELAQRTNSCLLALCNGAASPDEIVQYASVSGVHCTAVDIPTGYSHPLLSGFATDTFPEALYGREKNNISLKRNLSLLLSYMVGWHKLLFLDDDITELNGFNEALTANETIIGFLLADFPDNSVVRHAERLSGIEPGVSISGSSLLVDATKVRGFFPNVYNEDWFFMHVTARKGTVVNRGTASQLPYNPFSSPLRAVSEEFGDVLAEGIMQLSKLGIDPICASEELWKEILSDRRVLIDEICERLAVRNGNMEQSKDALAALCAAREQLGTIKPRTCVDYMAAWRKDVSEWRRRIHTLQKCLSVNQGLEVLGLL
jgi:hypothetical protein